ncbi:hypothetical protein [Vibrio parahaemolyticus]|uniref:hypothetical protein n=1 Tax=Vibrio parahaemolyticus TaxID=670 RepID=UPI00387AD4E7
MELSQARDIVKIVKPILLLTLAAFPFSSSASSNLLIGAWKCSSVLPISWLDTLSIYSPDGSFRGVANSITNSDKGVVEFDMYVDGSWTLTGNILKTNITSLEVFPKNSLAEKEIKTLKKAVNQPSLLNSDQEVIVLTKGNLKTKSNTGAVDNCFRAISASELKNKS